MRRLACLFVAALVFFPVFALADTNTDLLASINKYRATKHLSAIRESDSTCTIATIRAIQVMTNFSHEGFYPLVNSPWVQQGMWYENLFRREQVDFDVLKAWEHSPTHNANLLTKITNGCVRHIGNYWTFEAWHE